MRIFFIHGVSTRRTLEDLYEGLEAPASDGMRRKYDRELVDLEKVLTNASKAAGLGKIQLIPIYWGDQGARFHWYKHAGDGKVQPIVQPGVGLFRMLRSAGANTAQGTGRAPAAPHEEDIFTSLDLLASQCARQPASLRDLLLLEPLSTLHVLLDPIARRDDLSEAEFDALDARVANAARRVATDESVRRGFLAIDASAPDADLAVLQGVRDLLEGPDQAQGGMWTRLFGPILGAFTRLAVVQAKSPGVYLHGGRFFGDSVRYFSRRGTREAPGDVVKTVLAQIRKGLRDFPDGSPTVFMTHSLGSALFYDLFTYFAPQDLSFDLWISVGSQLGYYEDAKLLANSARDAGGYYGAPIQDVPAKVHVPLPKGARWFDMRDPRDPIGFPAAPIFENVVDVQFITRNHNFFEIHNAYFTDSRFAEALVDVLSQTFAKTDAPGTSSDPGAASPRR